MKRIISFVLALTMIFSCIPMMAFAADSNASSTCTVELDTTHAMPGDEVEVNVKISNNPGILGATLTLTYDDDLVLVNCANGTAFSELTMTKPSKYVSGCNFVWFGSEVANVVDGVILTLTFKVSENAQTSNFNNINVTCNDVFNKNYDVVNVTTVNGGIQVISYTPGDVTGDNSINPLDLIMLSQYISDGCITDPDGYNVTINEDAADVNNDGRMNPLDLIYISQYISDGCKTDPDGYNITLEPSSPKCVHTLEKTESVEATCTTTGNIEYWTCTLCKKLFSDDAGKYEISQVSTVIPVKDHTPGAEADCTEPQTCTVCGELINAALGHTEVSVPGYAAEIGKEGLTDGKKCTVCGEWIVEQEIIPALEKDEYFIEYKLHEYNTNKGDTYLKNQTIDNSQNPSRYFATETVDLKDISCAGYEFLGWYTADGTKVTKISADVSENLTLYARWNELTYNVNYKLYQTPLGSIKDEKYLSYTVSKGLVDLPNPEIYNYVFLGWYLDDGTEMTSIPVGTTGDITLNAYWTSKRNLAKSVPLTDPIICEDTTNNVIYFAYELGTIENVPVSDAIWTIQAVSGLAQQKSETVERSISTEKADSINATISKATVDSSTWTLASDWKQTTEINEAWAEDNGMTQSEAEENATSSSDTFLITSSSGGNSSTSNTDGTTTLTYNSENKTEETGSSFDVELSGKYYSSTEISASAKANVLLGEVSAGVKATTGFEIGGSVGYGNYGKDSVNVHSGTDTTNVDTTVTSDTSSWNSLSSKEATQEASQRSSVSKVLSQVISTEKGYGKSYAYGGSGSESFGSSNTSSESIDTSSTFVYTTADKKITTTTYSTDGKSDGCYRLVIAGKVHVFGVVGYDVASKSYFTYTYSILDDNTYEFLDYAPDLNFNDCENGVLPFEIPYFVYDYVTQKTAMTAGVLFTTNSADKTATITRYIGNNDDVILPSYVSSEGTSYKVTGIEATAFAGTDVRSVILSDHIDEIPNGAFKNCKNLESVSGYFTKIGDEAFSGCEKLTKFNISSNVVFVGNNAFVNVPYLSVDAASRDMALKYAKEQLPDANAEEWYEYAETLTSDLLNAVAISGAKNISVDISNVILSEGITLDIPGIESFELLGGKNTYNNVQIKSSANTTILKEIAIINQGNVPLELSSNELVFDAISAQSNSYVMLLSSDSPNISLIRDNTFKSNIGEAVVIKEPTLTSLIVDNSIGYISIYGNVYLCGNIIGEDSLTVNDGAIIELTEEEYLDYIKGVNVVSFDPNGGKGTAEVYVSKNNSEGSNVSWINPYRKGYEFGGWTDGVNEGELVYDADGLCIKGGSYWDENGNWRYSDNVMLYAKWIPLSWTVTAKATNGGIASGSKTVSAGETVELVAIANNGYAFEGWYDGETLVCENEVFAVINVVEDKTYIAKFNMVYESWTDNSKLPDIAGSYKLETDVTIADPWSVPSGIVNLCLHGHKITYTGNECIIKVDNTAELNITDCTGGGMLYAESDADFVGEAYAGIWSTGGTVTMDSGKLYVKNTSNSSNVRAIVARKNSYLSVSGDAIIESYGSGAPFGLCTGSDSIINISDNAYIYAENIDPSAKDGRVRAVYGETGAVINVSGTPSIKAYTPSTTNTANAIRLNSSSVNFNGTPLLKAETELGISSEIHYEKSTDIININCNLENDTPYRVYKVDGGVFTQSTDTKYNDAVKFVSALGGKVEQRVNGQLYIVEMPYTVIFNGNGATNGSMSDQSRKYNDGVALTANTFSRKYTVTYNHNGSGASNTTGTATYSFAGWATTAGGAVAFNDRSTANITTSGEVTLYAKWNSASVTLPTPTRTGYTFGGWYKESACTNKIGNGGASYTPTADVTLYAKWTANTYTVTFDSDVSPKTKVVAYGSTYGTLPTPIKTGYKFGGWYTSGGEEVVSTTKVSTASDHTLYVYWIPETYTVTYSLNTASSDLVDRCYTSTSPSSYANKTVTFSQTYGTLPTPTAEYYTFDGWYTAASGGTKVTSSAIVATAGNHTLYAHWTKTKSGYTYVKTRTDLINIKDDLSGNYMLISDIDLSGSNWSKLGTFKGNLEGNGKTISGLTYSGILSESTGRYGMFDELNGATVSNVTFAYVSINTDNDTNTDHHRVGTLAAYSTNSTITNVAVSGQVKFDGSYGGIISIGGLIGEAVQSTIRGCKNSAYTLGAKGFARVGGIAGASSNTLFDGCSNSGYIEAHGMVALGHAMAGGILGLNEGKSTLPNNNSNTGDIKSSGDLLASSWTNDICNPQ